MIIGINEWRSFYRHVMACHVMPYKLSPDLIVNEHNLIGLYDKLTVKHDFSDFSHLLAYNR